MIHNTLGNHIDNSLISNAFGFLRFPLNFYPYNSNSEWVITGVPFDIATTGKAGSRNGPTAIRQASVNLAWENCRWPWTFRLNDRLKIIDCGDLVYSFGDAQDMCVKLQKHIEKLLECNKQCLTFGGDHFISLPLLRAHYKYFGKMTLIHFDAHTDTFNNNNKYDHGSVFYHAYTEGLIDPLSSIQIGIRTEFCSKNSFKILDAMQINNGCINDILTEIKDTVGNKCVYLTFDIDCLDPAFAPGTGTQVVGGLTSDCVLKLIRGLQCLNIIGMDLVEVAPAYDKSEITALLAATIALEMLYIQASKKK